MAKVRAYRKLEDLMDAELLQYTRCENWDQAANEFECVALTRALVRSTEYNGVVWYMINPQLSEEERYEEAEKHRTHTPAVPHNVVSEQPSKVDYWNDKQRADVPAGTPCDRHPSALARVGVTFASGPLYFCAHCARQHGFVEALS